MFLPVFYHHNEFNHHNDFNHDHIDIDIDIDNWLHMPSLDDNNTDNYSVHTGEVLRMLNYHDKHFHNRNHNLNKYDNDNNDHHHHKYNYNYD
jgi:hypothetical protein